MPENIPHNPPFNPYPKITDSGGRWVGVYISDLKLESFCRMCFVFGVNMGEGSCKKDVGSMWGTWVYSGRRVG